MENMERTESKGLATDRPLVDYDSINFVGKDYGALKIVGLRLEDLQGKKILDVGTGGGASFAQAINEFHLDYYALDILPAVNMRLISRRKGALLQEMQNKLLSIVVNHPDRFKTADATKRIPYQDNTFDVVMSCLALPDYAQNAKEAIVSLYEMMRVSRELVACTSGWDPQKNPKGILSLGDLEPFQFSMKMFLDDLSFYGISYTVDEHPIIKGKEFFFLHIDTRLKKGFKNLISFIKPEKYLPDQTYIQVLHP